MTTAGTTVSQAQRRVVEALKRVDAATAPELGGSLGTTSTAARQHLDALSRLGLVTSSDPSSGAPEDAPPTRGRPAQRWRLTPLAASLFPDRHAEVTVSLIETIRSTMGPDGLDRIVDARSAAQLDHYRHTLPDPATTPLGERVEALARLRTLEGYMGEATREGDGYLLIEHHCPICDAATACHGFCRSELELFRAVLGEDARVERVQHLMEGDGRCAYRVTPIRRTGAT